MKCVIDASFLASLFLPGESSRMSDDLAKDLVTGPMTAPSLLQIEMTNILVVAERRKRITGTQLQQLSTAFDKLPITLQPPLTPEQRSAVLQLAQKHTLSAYDAAYLELSMRLGISLATLDNALKKAARAEGVKCLPAGT